VTSVTEILGPMNTLRSIPGGNATMSLTKKAEPKLSDYGLVLALICMALALVVAKYSRQQPSVQFPSAVASAVEESK